MTIVELYTQFPKMPLAKHHLTTLDTDNLNELLTSVQEEIKSFKIFSSVFDTYYESYCFHILKTTQKLLKQRAKEEKKRGKIFKTVSRYRG